MNTKGHDGNHLIHINLRIHNVLHFEKDRIVVEKCRDRTLTELRELLPAYLSDKNFIIYHFRNIN